MDKIDNLNIQTDETLIVDDLLKRLVFLRDAGVDYVPISEDLHSNSTPIKAVVIKNIIEAECQECELSSGRTSVIVGEGERRAKVMVVGDLPTKLDDSEGKPFTGSEGELLEKIIKSMGLTSKDIYKCFAVRCYSNIEVTDEHISKCRQHLINDYNRVRPKAVIAFGSLAGKSLESLKVKNLFLVPSLKDTIEDPTLKIETWDKVQKIMQVL